MNKAFKMIGKQDLKIKERQDTSSISVI